MALAGFGAAQVGTGRYGGAGYAKAQVGAPAATSPGGGGTAGGGTAGGGGGGGGINTSYKDAYSKILSRLEGGGKSLEGDLAGIEAGKAEAIARGEQNIVSSGLSGTTIMAGVPIAAEKTAGLQRLKARGTAEDKYLQALTSFAGLAFQAEEGRLNRAASLSRQTSGGGSTYIPESERRTYGAGYDAAGNWAGSGTPTSPSTTTSADGTNLIGSGYYGDYRTKTNNADQYPSLYGSGGQLPSAPNLAPAPAPFDYTGYSSDIKAAGEGSQRIVGAPEWQQPYNQG